MKVSDSERKIIGGIDGVSSDLFSDKFDYVALGHLHRPEPGWEKDSLFWLTDTPEFQ